MWSYTSDENSWLSRTGKAILDYCERTGTARAHRLSTHYAGYITRLTENEKKFK
jgi:hypothetical protein